MNRKKDIQNVVNLCEFAKRFEDLRCEGRYAQSYKEVSKGIEDKTGVYISHTQLSKYTKMGVQEEVTRGVSAKNAIAIAEYFNVSVEYLLGLSNSRSYKDKYKVGSKAFGLSDEAMETLEKALEIPSIFQSNFKETSYYKEFSTIDFINYMIVNFSQEFASAVGTYLSHSIEQYSHKIRKQRISQVLKQQILISKFAITQLSDEFLEKIQQELLNTKTETD